MSFCSQQIPIYISMTIEVMPLRYNLHIIFYLLPELNSNRLVFKKTFTNCVHWCFLSLLAGWGKRRDIKQRKNMDKSGAIDWQASKGPTNQCDFEGDGGYLLCFTFLASILHSAVIRTPTYHLRTLPFCIL